MRLSFWGIIFLIALVIVILQPILSMSFGWLGIVSWVFVVVGAIFLILWLLSQICGW